MGGGWTQGGGKEMLQFSLEGDEIKLTVREARDFQFLFLFTLNKR